MQRDLILPGAIAGLAVVAVVTGLTLTGGLARGKAEQRDQARLTALNNAKGLVECLSQRNDRTVPETLTTAEACDPLDVLNDPYSGTPVRFERLSSTRYQLCPQLELPDDIPDRYWMDDEDFDAKSGCMRYTYRP